MRIIIVAGTKTKSGGNIVLLSIISLLKELGLDTAIYCLDEPVSTSWKQRHPEILQVNYDEINHNDMLIVSEEFVFAVMLLGPRCQKYIIINQGIGSSYSSDWKRNTYAVHSSIYNNALGVICNSEHTASGVKRVFNVDDNRIIIIPVPICDVFKPGLAEKTNTICFMPRKNRTVQAFVTTYLSGIFTDWEFVSIDDMDENQIAEVMQQSKYFLSFGGPEGLGMPPIEAALCGCRVIGFDGYGGEEYFKEPIFTKVDFYDHIQFIDKCEIQISQPWDYTQEMEQQRIKLRDYYSLDNLRKSIEIVYNRFIKEHNNG